MSINNKALEEKLDKVINRLDIITVILLKNSGMKRKDIAKTLDVSEKTIERLISISKLKDAKDQVSSGDETNSDLEKK